MLNEARWRTGAVVVLATGLTVAAVGGLRVILPLLLALVAALASVAAGGIVLRLLVPLLGPQRAWPVSKLFVAGYPVFGTLCFAVGLYSTSGTLLWTITTVLALFGVGVVVGRPRFDRDRDPVAPGAILIDWMIAGAALVTGVLFAQLPPFTLDELAYHLAAPKIWLMEGRILELPLNSHSWFPFGIEGADLPLLLAGGAGALASHFLHLFAAIAAFQLLRRELTPRTGLLYAPLLAFVTTPALLVTAGWSWNEWPLIAVCILLTAELRRFSEGSGSGAMLALSIAAGLLTKYTFIPFAAILLIAAAVTSRGAVRRLAGAAAAGTLAGSFFLLRNFVLTGDALYPFLSPLAPSVSGYRRESTLLLTLQSYAFDRRFVDESLLLGLFLCGLIAIVFSSRVEGLFIRVAGLLSALAGLALLIATAPSSRIVLPFFVPAVFATSESLRALSAGAARLLQWTLRAGAAVQVAIVLIYLQSFAPFDVLLRRTAPDEFLQQHRRLYPQITWLNEVLPAESRTLVLGAQELFWFDRRVRGGGNFDGPRLSAYLAESDAARMRRDGFTHVAMITDGLRVRPSGDIRRRERETVLDDRAAANLTRLIGRDARLVARNGSATLFALQ